LPLGFAEDRDAAPGHQVPELLDHVFEFAGLDIRPRDLRIRGTAFITVDVAVEAGQELAQALFAGDRAALP